jgi:predicted AAA+ superfamily ATPase
MLLTGSSSVLVARGGRESLAGRVFTTEMPAFSFREVLECWRPKLASALPPAIPFGDAFEGGLVACNRAFDALRPQQKLSIRRALERYLLPGGAIRAFTVERSKTTSGRTTSCRPSSTMSWGRTSPTSSR